MSSNSRGECSVLSAVCASSQRAVCVLLIGLFSAMTVVGCGGTTGPERFAVEGTVTLDGAPLADGLVRFLPSAPEGGPAAAAAISAGKFKLEDDEGPVSGEHRVEIEATNFQGFEIDDEAAFAVAASKPGNPPIAANPVPAVYNQQSTLTCTINVDSPNVLTFDLKSNVK